MKPNRTNPHLFRLIGAIHAISITFLGLAQAANENRYWDGGTANIGTIGDGASQGTAGNWNTTLTNWDQGTGLAHVAWVIGNNDYAVFGGTAGAVTLTSAVSANKLTFNTTAYSIAGNTLTLSGPAPEIAMGTGISASISSIIAGTTGLNKSGLGTLTINNTTAANSFTGGTTINGGILSIGTGGAADTARVDALGTGTVAVNSGTLRLWIKNTGTYTIANNLTVNGGTILNQDGIDTLSGTVAVGASGATFQAVYDTKNLTLSGVVSGSGPVTVNGGSGMVLLTNTGNTYSGGTTLSGGRMSISAGNGLGTGTFNITKTTGNSGTVGTLTVANTAATTVANAITLPAPGSAQSYSILKNATNATSGTLLTLSGNITGGGANTTLLLSSNTGGDTTTTYKLTGANTFTGKVQIYRGSLIVTAPNATGAATNTLELNSNNGALGDLRFDTAMTYANPVNILSAGTISTNGNNVTLSGVLGGTAAWNKVGTGTLALTANNTLTGATSVGAGILQLDYTTNSDSKLADLAALTFAGGTLDLAGTNVTPHVELVGSTTVSANSGLTRTGSTANQIDLGAIASSGGTLDIAANGIATTSTALANGLLPSFITVGGAPATTNGSNEIVAATGIIDVNRLGGVISNGASANVRIVEGGPSGDVTMAASGITTIATLTNAGSAGPTVVNIGVGNKLRLGALGTLAAGSNGLGITGGTLTAGGADDTTGVIDFFNSSATAATISSIIADNGTGIVDLTKGGSGALVLGGANTYTGITTVNAGILGLAGGAAIPDDGNVVMGTLGSATLRLDSSETIGSLAGGAASGGGVNLQANTLTIGNSTTTYSGPISGTGNLVKTGGGTTTIQATVANTYSGTTTVAGGSTLILDNNAAALTTAYSSSGYVIGGASTLTFKSTSGSGTRNDINAKTITFDSTGGGTLSNQAGNWVMSNCTITTNGGVANALSGTAINTNNGATVIDTAVRGTGVVDLDVLNGLTNSTSATAVTKNGVGILRMSAANTYTGGIVINAGTWLANVATTAFGTNSAVILKNSATADVGGSSQTLGSLSDGGTTGGILTNSGASPATITVGNATNTSFAGAIQDGTGTVALTKVGTGTQTLAGTNTYTGATTLSAGTLNITGNTGFSALTMAASTTLAGEGTVASLTTAGASALTVNPQTLGAFSSTGALTLGGTMTVTLSATPTGSSIRILNHGGTAATLANFALTNSSAYHNPVFSVTGSTVDLTLDAAANLTWTATGGTNWDVNTTSNWSSTTPPTITAAKFYTGDAVIFSDSVGANQTIAIAADVQPSGIVFNNSSYSYVLNRTSATVGKIIGTTGITKNGTGVVTLGGADGQNFTGPIAVNAGTLKMGNRDAFGLTSGITVANNATVDINSQTPGTVPTGGYTYTISGNGVDGNGAIVNSGTDSASNAGVKSIVLTGNASIGTATRFDVGFANTAGTGTITGNGYTLTKKGIGGIGFRGDASGSPINVVVEAGRVWAENADLAFGGATGTLTIKTGAKAGTYGPRIIATPVTVESGGTLYNEGNATGTWSGAIALADTATIDTGTDINLSGTATLAANGSLAKTGTAQLTITGSLTGTTGTLNQNAGTVQIGNVGATGSISGFTTVNVGGGLLFRNRLSGANNTISANFTFATASSELRQHAGLEGDTLTLTGIIGNSTATGVLQPYFGRMVLGSGANATVNLVPLVGATATPGVLEVKTGASLTTPYLNVGNAGGNSGVVAIAGGTVTIPAGGNGIRIGHWNNNSATTPSAMNVTGGTLDASATNVTTNVGWDGYGVMTVGGGAGAAVAKVWKLQTDANGDSTGYNDTLTLLPNGTLEVGGGGTAGVSTTAANDRMILNGGTISGKATSTWACPWLVSSDSVVSVDSGAIVSQTGQLNGSGNLVKLGTGTFKVSTASPAFSGGIDTQAGTTELSAAVTTGLLQASGTGTLFLGSAASGPVVALPGGTIRTGSSVAGSSATVSSSLNLAGGTAAFRVGNAPDKLTATSLTVSDNSQISVIPDRVLSIGEAFTVIDYDGTVGGLGVTPSSLTFASSNPHLQGVVIDDTVLSEVYVSITSADSVVWKGDGDANGDWDVATSNNWRLGSSPATASKYYDFDVVSFDDNGIDAPNVTLVGAITPAALEVANTTGTYTFQGTGLTGGTGLSKSGGGGLVLLNTNTNAGAVAISGGTVTVGNGGTAGTLGGGGAISITPAATLVYKHSDSVVLNRAVIGGGKLVQSGTGTLRTGSANNNVDITVTSGTFQISEGGWATGYFTTANRQVLVDGGILQSTVTHSFGGLGGNFNRPDVTITNGGIWKLSAEQYMSGSDVFLTGGNIVQEGNDFRLEGGTMTVSGAATASTISRTGTGSVTLHGDPTFQVADGAAATDFEISAPVNESGVHGIIKSGAGLMVLSGTNTYTGTTNVNGGTLQVGNGSTTGNLGSGTVTNNATLAFNRSDAINVANVIAGTGELRQNGSGTTTLSGINTYTGNTTVNAGTLVLADNARLMFKLGAASGSSNTLTGTGTMTIEGDFTIDTTAADALAAGTWLLENVSSLTGAYGENFAVVNPDGSSWNNIGGNKWSKAGVGAGQTWTFDETTGTLTVASAGYDSWASQIQNAADRDRGDDPDGDGFTNLQEFLFGTSPVAGNGSLATTEKSGNTLIIRWKQRASGASYALKQSATLNSDWTPSGVTPSTDGALSGDYQPMKAEVTIGAGKLFFRVEGAEN